MIKVKDLRYKYKNNSSETLHGLDFSVAKGEVFGFLGPSGAGKSTTQKILTGLNKGYSGSVIVDNRELNKIGRNYYENIGVSFELPNLYTQFTARENLEFFSSFYSNKTANIDGLLESVGLLEDSNRKVETFSKGMKMRLNFIRSFINNPNLIFLDEPTSGLDPVNAALIKDLIINKRETGATIFVTTHNMQVATEICDRVAFVVDGEIKLIDSPKNLMWSYGKKEVVLEYFNNEKVEVKEFLISELQNNSDFLNIINNHTVKTMHTKEATLDDVFVKITGRSLT